MHFRWFWQNRAALFICEIGSISRRSTQTTTRTQQQTSRRTSRIPRCTNFLSQAVPGAIRGSSAGASTRERRSSTCPCSTSWRQVRNFVLRMMDFVLQMMDFVLQMMDFVLNLMFSAQQSARTTAVSLACPAATWMAPQLGRQGKRSRWWFTYKKGGSRIKRVVHGRWFTDATASRTLRRKRPAAEVLGELDNRWRVA